MKHDTFITTITIKEVDGDKVSVSSGFGDEILELSFFPNHLHELLIPGNQFQITMTNDDEKTLEGK